MKKHIRIAAVFVSLGALLTGLTGVTALPASANTRATVVEMWGYGNLGGDPRGIMVSERVLKNGKFIDGGEFDPLVDSHGNFSFHVPFTINDANPQDTYEYEIRIFRGFNLFSIPGLACEVRNQQGQQIAHQEVINASRVSCVFKLNDLK
ncbi:hypothetical protein [Lysinibacter sp. HNR]|uniref:hypothetical protein n=1 Tax=Lysinibacter sp. HNR TaxID=3031408 RepID=UPI002434CF48|nr:hypothetical protein [Lysinibacter sp. HNR]WGD38521.1 hypothetical protein FrondiHNR_06330 [Lysinibacter sp. HNR]